MSTVLRPCALALFLFTIAGCGGQARKLVAVTVAPNNADAQNFAAGQVQFSAVGTYDQPPTTVQLTNKDIGWCIGSASGQCAGFIYTGATIDGNGLASCGPGFTGTVTVLAGQSDSQSPMPDIGFQLRVFGSAQLTCP